MWLAWGRRSDDHVQMRLRRSWGRVVRMMDQSRGTTILKQKTRCNRRGFRSVNGHIFGK